MVHLAMKKFLAELAVLKAGHPFRGKIPEDVDGSTLAVQIRDIDQNGDIDWSGVIRTNIFGRKVPDYLIKGDVIFAARGQRNVAACISEVNEPAVCAPHYFLIQLRSKKEILPEFLSWQLNQEPAQRYFSQSAEGSLQVSIRRNVLEQLPIAIPSLDKQRRIVELHNQAKNEKRILNALIENRTKQMHFIAQDILK